MTTLATRAQLPATCGPDPGAAAGTKPVGDRRSRQRVPVLMPRTSTLALLLVTADITKLVSYGPDWRYPLVFALFTVAVFFDVHQTRRRGGGPVTLPFVLLASWVVALWISALADGQWRSNTLIVIVTYLMLALGAANMWLPGRRLLRRRQGPWAAAPYWAGGLLGLVGTIDALTGEPGVPVNLLHHERGFVVVTVLCLPHRRHGWVAKALVATATAASLGMYPAATTALVLMLASATWFITRGSRHPIGLTLLAGAVAAWLVLSGVAAAMLRYFYEASGRYDNTNTRELLWSQAMTVVHAEPIAGGATRASITYLANINARIQYTPIHNSYITTMVVGGVVACTLLVVALVGLAAAGLSQSLAERRTLGTQWLPTLTAATLSMFVNPVVDKFGNSALLIACLLAGLGSLTRQWEPDQDG